MLRQSELVFLARLFERQQRQHRWPTAVHFSLWISQVPKSEVGWVTVQPFPAIFNHDRSQIYTNQFIDPLQNHREHYRRYSPSDLQVPFL
jgi:hypothetical protein